VSPVKRWLTLKFRAAFSASGKWGVGTALHFTTAVRTIQVVPVISTCVEISEFPVIVDDEFVLRKRLYRVIIVIKHVIAPSLWLINGNIIP